MATTKEIPSPSALELDTSGLSVDPKDVVLGPFVGLCANFGAVNHGMWNVKGQESVHVAVKMINLKNANLDDAGRKQLIREVNLMWSLKDSNVLKVYGACFDENARDLNRSKLGCFLLLEYCEGGSLRKALDRLSQGDTSKLASWPERLHVALGISKGMVHISSQTPRICHKMLKVSGLL